MKNGLLIFTLSLTCLTCIPAMAQKNQQPDSLGLPGDNLNLYAVLDVFQKSKTLEAFEKSLNSEETKINNLDLNDDDKIDYIKVIDNMKGNSHAIALQIPVSEKENQDVAVIVVEKDSTDKISVQIIGDETLYGKNYIIEPDEAPVKSTPNPGYTGGETTTGNTTINNTTINNTTTNNTTTNNTSGKNNEEIDDATLVASWLIFGPLFAPAYIAYHSPYYWGYYPPYFHPWPPVGFAFYAGYHAGHYHGHYHSTVVIHSHSYHNHYHRSGSPTVDHHRRDGSYNKTYNRPANQPANKPGNAGGGVNKPSNQPANKPGGGNKPSNKPSAGTQPANKPSAGNQPANNKPSAGTRPANQPSKQPATQPSRQPSYNKPSSGGGGGGGMRGGGGGGGMRGGGGGRRR